MYSFPRETLDFLPVVVTTNGVQVFEGVQFADVPDGSRPLTWVAQVVDGGRIGVAVTGYPPGKRHLYAKVSDSPWAPVIDCGVYLIT